MLERRSVRKYLDKEIPINELKEVLALAQSLSAFQLSRIASPVVCERAAVQGDCRSDTGGQNEALQVHASE